MSAKVEISSGVEVAEIDGRPVLQPACNRVARADEGNNNGRPTIRKSLKPSPAPKSVASKPPLLQNLPLKHVSSPQAKSPPSSPSVKPGLLTIPSKHAMPRSQVKSPSLNKPPLPNALDFALPPLSPSPGISKDSPAAPGSKLSPPISPRNNSSKPKSAKPSSPIIKPSSQRALLKRANDAASLNLSSDKQSSNEAATPKASSKGPIVAKSSISGRKKPRKLWVSEASVTSTKAPGSLAAARKAEISEIQAQRKLKIAHYGRKQGTLKAEKVVPEEIAAAASLVEEIRRCDSITSQTDPAYIAYHDQEWGVPVHDDKMLFELLALMGAQVGMNWTTILIKREIFRDAFAGFDTSIVANFSERQISSINAEYGILDVDKIRGVVENARRILEIIEEFGSFDKYIWSFVNFKPIVNKYMYGRKIPVKTSKAETISKDLVKRNFRFVGPTIMYSFMQAAGLTNDHLVNCFRHQECIRISQQGSST